MNDYRRCIEYWDRVFSDEPDRIPALPETENDTLDEALRWLTTGASRVLDFGCGNGSLLFLCALLGTKEHVGVDLSTSAIDGARRRAERMSVGSYGFYLGGVEQLESIPDRSIDGIILSNILDNLYPEDAQKLLSECARLLRPGGKILLKLNPYLTPEQIQDWNVRVISGNLLDDGLLLWNNTTRQWRDILSGQFTIEREGEVY
ncbi:MAG: class I SAM-dependent methyltransferase [Clostridiales bacterium]|nr:class I SAM-dependent methyltransferase [Clostridiales bacterium]